MRSSGGLMGACLAIVLALGVGCDSERSDGDGWGYVMIQLLRAANQDESPFIGTDTISARVSYDGHYSSCVADFFGENPSWRDDGLDGGPVFEEWQTRVCEAQPRCDYEPIPCDSANIWQSGLDNDIDPPSLNVDYHLIERRDDEIENRVLIVGPLPPPEMLDCEEEAPTMSIQAPDVTGQGSEGNPIWQGTSAPEDKASTNQGLPMKVRVAAL